MTLPKGGDIHAKGSRKDPRDGGGRDEPTRASGLQVTESGDSDLVTQRTFALSAK